MEDLIFTVPSEDDLPKMRRLWKETFNDTDEYLDIVFNNYVDTTYCLVCKNSDKLVAQLIGIPYNFYFYGKEIQGLYMCGLATLPDYRGMGIMGKLISLSDQIISRYSFPFSFLIPADSHLRSYYSKFGFLDTHLLKHYKIKNYTCDDFSVTNIVKEGCHGNDMFTTQDGAQVNFQVVSNATLSADLLKEIISIAIQNEIENNGTFHIIHNERDWRLVIKEKLESGSVLVSDRTSRSSVFFIDQEGGVELISGDVANAETILSDLMRHFLKNESETLYEKPLDRLSVDGGKRKIVEEEETEYGMVRFSERFLSEILVSSQGSENRIFENPRGVVRKYGKMDFWENQDNLAVSLASQLQFRFMLD